MKQIQFVKEIKRPLNIGEIFMVKCIVDYVDGKRFITPVIDHPHTDPETGQDEEHYHADYRFIKHRQKDVEGNSDRVFAINRHSKHVYALDTRPVVGEPKLWYYKGIPMQRIEYHPLPVVNEFQQGITDPLGLAIIPRCKKDMKKKRCPHHGYDLSQERAQGGVITCPLHGLKFCAVSGRSLWDKMQGQSISG